MLTQLTIRNFAIVDHLEIEWHAGLNVITGETGAGKSILIDAVGALLGDRLGPDVVRSGAQRALVEGVFWVPDRPSAALAAVLEEYGLEAEDGALIVGREIGGSGGRGGARVNGRSVPLSVLQQLGETLIDVHGQSEHMALLRPREQLEYLDRYAGLVGQRADMARLVRELRGAREALRELQDQEREAARMHDVLQHEIQQIDSAGVRAGEEEELLIQRGRLEHAERLRQSAQQAHDALLGGEQAGTDAPGAVDLLGRAAAACEDGGRIDPALAAQADALRAALEQATDAGRALRDYLEGIEADPAALDQLTERLFLIGDLKRKYGASVADVLAYAISARERLAAIEHRGERLAELRAREASTAAEVDAAAARLSEARTAAGARLSAAVAAELRDLRLANARLLVALARADDVELTGMDRVELRLAANADDEPRPLARVASGGELARIALALKTVLARAEPRPTLIFDEIDMGVGGRTAPVVGEKLRAIALGGHQVLCVTHMAQVAAFADHHFVVTKASGTAAVSVVEVAAEARVDELAAMLAGRVTDAARQSARELVALARSFQGGSRS